ncbi:pentatricopeptide repeat-containing protein At3g49730 isoform X1 [Amborella trichopoda]|nr:pentatricopeptide repeat-containing protein At3g49730 isoform X1 [Amborella trichopoda]XP_020520631.1 pentatricopeptide repeat-containing protein At3g49730 isoform X1 [Amborella trichopoda]XP_020520632.1 pentatricopeptide repeat-containing protein At3g49730 isoform X1 [Amborella trichopoda]XP_020520633.1 pentatricopeptide repeat-containing protein At3g49730 isoform X1 [Amborella trichopoda]XP_020520634.1 pentatricopeptide repeat-containing protein At3g49730 isoform X1 [Amborella trichopoda]|eukprot:XP_020520630.1 pentatricopeptide repeat-containing protein At3g49730 isoform X1 [Amborella trichopoda]
MYFRIMQRLTQTIRPCKKCSLFLFPKSSCPPLYGETMLDLSVILLIGTQQAHHLSSGSPSLRIGVSQNSQETHHNEFLSNFHLASNSKHGILGAYKEEKKEEFQEVVAVEEEEEIVCRRIESITHKKESSHNRFSPSFCHAPNAKSGILGIHKEDKGQEFEIEGEEDDICRRIESITHKKESFLTDKKPGIYAQSLSQGESFSNVENIYNILKRFHNKDHQLKLALTNGGIVLSPSLVEKVLKRCGESGNLSFRFFIWSSKQPGYCHSYDCYKLMIKQLGKMRQFGTVWALLEEMRKDNPEHITPETFVILLRRFAASRMVGKAIEVLDEMPKFGCEPDEHTFGCLLDALCKNNAVKEAASLFEDMKYKFSPNLKHYTSLLYGWCREGKIIEAKHILVQMKEAGFEPDIVVYNNLLSGFAIAEKMEDGYDLLIEMKHKGYPPNATSYTILIQALCSKGRMEEALRLFVEMKRNGCLADVVTYTTLISGFCKVGKLDNAYELLESMVKQGCRPNQMTYLCILGAHEKKEELEECLELVREMSKTGIKPDANIYNTLIRLACKLGQVKEAFDVWNEMEAKGFSAGIDSFTIMIHGLLLQGNSLIDACKYFKEMVGRGLLATPQYGTFKELLNGLMRAGKLEMGKDIWDTIRSGGCHLNVYAYTIWIHSLFDHGHVKEACGYCLEMLDGGIMPQADTFAKLMRGLRKLYNRQIAAEITERVRQMASDRNMSFKSYSRRGVKLDLEKLTPKKKKNEKDAKKAKKSRFQRHRMRSS